MSEEKSIICSIRLPNQRAYEVAWAIAKLKGYETLEEWINDVVVDAIEMFPDGRAGFDSEEIDYGFKTKWQIGQEQQEKVRSLAK